MSSTDMSSAPGSLVAAWTQPKESAPVFPGRRRLRRALGTVALAAGLVAASNGCTKDDGVTALVRIRILEERFRPDVVWLSWTTADGAYGFVDQRVPATGMLPRSGTDLATVRITITGPPDMPRKIRAIGVAGDPPRQTVVSADSGALVRKFDYDRIFVVKLQARDADGDGVLDEVDQCPATPDPCPMTDASVAPPPTDAQAPADAGADAARPDGAAGPANDASAADAAPDAARDSAPGG